MSGRLYPVAALEPVLVDVPVNVPAHQKIEDSNYPVVEAVMGDKEGEISETTVLLYEAECIWTFRVFYRNRSELPRNTCALQRGDPAWRGPVLVMKVDRDVPSWVESIHGHLDMKRADLAYRK